MNPELAPLLVTLGLFSLGVLPLLIDNLKTGRATNRNNAILALAGLASAAVNHGAGWDQQSLWATGGWLLLGSLGLFLLTSTGFLPGGIAKTMMALLLWFPVADYLLVIAVGFVMSGLLALANKRVAPMVAPLVLSSVGVWLHAFSGVS